MKSLSLPRLYAIIDANVTERHGWTVVTLASAYLDGGATLLQLRCRDRHTGEVLLWADELVARAARYGARVIINDRADVARMSGATGVHLGQEDLSVGAARSIGGPGMAIGMSTHSSAQFHRALVQPIDYLAIGPVYGTKTKRIGDAPIGLDLVRAAVATSLGIPVVAIGGITLDRISDVMAAGVTSVAVIADLLRDGVPERQVRAYLDRLEK